METNLRVGVLGTGFGQTHARIWAGMDGVELAGIAGRDEHKTRQAAAALGAPGFTDPQALLNDPAVDLIDLCLPTPLHAAFAVAALEAGKHVFCEIPAAYTLAEAERMAQAARASGKHLLVGIFSRFQPENRLAQHMLRAGRLGAPRSIAISRRTAPVWGRWDEHFIHNLMIHDLDTACWLLGSLPAGVAARGLPLPTGGWNHVDLLLDAPTACVAIQGSGLMPASFPFHVALRLAGETGALDLSWRWAGDHPESELIYYPAQGAPERLECPPRDPYEAECAYARDCLRGQADPALLNIEAALPALRVAEAAQTSLVHSGARVAL